MSSRLENFTEVDSNIVANGIMYELADVEKMERMLNFELSSADLFKIDSAILSSLKNTQDFSRDLLEQLENGKFETVSIKPPKSLEAEIQDIQQEAMFDITLPLQEMFDQMNEIIVDVLRS